MNDAQGKDQTTLEWLQVMARTISNIGKPGTDNNYGRAASEIERLRRIEAAAKEAYRALTHVYKGRRDPVAILREVFPDVH